MIVLVAIEGDVESEKGGESSETKTRAMWEG